MAEWMEPCLEACEGIRRRIAYTYTHEWVRGGATGAGGNRSCSEERGARRRDATGVREAKVKGKMTRAAPPSATHLVNHVPAAGIPVRAAARVVRRRTAQICVFNDMIVLREPPLCADRGG